MEGWKIRRGQHAGGNGAGTPASRLLAADIEIDRRHAVVDNLHNAVEMEHHAGAGMDTDDAVERLFRREAFEGGEGVEVLRDGDQPPPTMVVVGDEDGVVDDDTDWSPILLFLLHQDEAVDAADCTRTFDLSGIW
jgi:hypothetical protein